MKKAFFATIGFCILFGLQIVLQQLFLKSSIQPLHLSFLTNLSSLILLTIYFSLFNRKVFSFKINKKAVIWFFAAAVLWIIADLSTMFGLSLSSSINLSLLSRLQVFLTYILAVLFFHETFLKNKLLTVILSLVGGIILVLNFQSSIKFNFGDLLFFIFTLAISLSGLFRQNVTKYISPFQMTYLMYILSVSLMGIMTFIFFPLSKIEVPGFIIFNSVIGVSGFILVNYAISVGGATFFSVVSSLLPLFTAFFSYLILKQLPSINQLVGGLIIIFSIYLFQKKSVDK